MLTFLPFLLTFFAKQKRQKSKQKRQKISQPFLSLHKFSHPLIPPIKDWGRALFFSPFPSFGPPIKDWGRGKKRGGHWFVPFALLCPSGPSLHLCPQSKIGGENKGEGEAKPESKVAYKLAYFLLTFLQSKKGKKVSKKGKKSASPFLLWPPHFVLWGDKKTPLCGSAKPAPSPPPLGARGGEKNRRRPKQKRPH